MESDTTACQSNAQEEAGKSLNLDDGNPTTALLGQWYNEKQLFWQLKKPSVVLC